MNHFFYESRGKEKIKELRNEGESSQSFYRSGASKQVSLPALSKVVIALLGLIGFLGLLVR